MAAPRFVLNDQLIARMSAADRKRLGVKTREEITTQQTAKAEKVIQAEVESYLRLNGFCPRTPAFLDGKAPKSGWYIHLNQARGNPILLDLLICTLDGRCLELELKTATGPIRAEQSAILATTPGATLARSTTEAIDQIKAWRETIAAEIGSK